MRGVGQRDAGLRVAETAKRICHEDVCAVVKCSVADENNFVMHVCPTRYVGLMHALMLHVHIALIDACTRAAGHPCGLRTLAPSHIVESALDAVASLSARRE